MIAGKVLRNAATRMSKGKRFIVQQPRMDTITPGVVYVARVAMMPADKGVKMGKTITISLTERQQLMLSELARRQKENRSQYIAALITREFYSKEANEPR